MSKAIKYIIAGLLGVALLIFAIYGAISYVEKRDMGLRQEGVNIGLNQLALAVKQNKEVTYQFITQPGQQSQSITLIEKPNVKK